MHVAQPVEKPDVKDKTCFNCGKKGHLAENCPEPKKCSHCGKKGHLAKDCWKKHPDKKPTAKPKAKGQPTKPGGRQRWGKRWKKDKRKRMCVRGKAVTVAASSSSAERVCSEHRVDEINLAEKFQSIGVGDPKRRWLVDSGATCHIISFLCPCRARSKLRRS